MFHDIQQNSDDWLNLRNGKVTGSAISKIMANFGKAFGEPAKKLAVDIALAQITGKLQENNYSNEHMERGHLLEPIARHLYEDFYFCNVLNGGFFDNGFTGCSPDGLIDSDGVIEIKSVIPSVQYKTIKRNMPDPAYKWQLIFNLKETDREWIDYISFCSNFPENNKLFIHRIERINLDYEFKCIDSRLDEFKFLVNEIKQDIK